MKGKLLIVEDDFEIARAIREYLSSRDYSITWASTGVEGLDEFKKQNFDLLLVDIMMPEMNGIELLKNIRLASQVPIIILSAKDGELDKVEGLNIGADDYMTKPFSLLELEARINRHLKRNIKQNTKTSEVEYYHGLKVNVENEIIYLQEKRLDLTQKEMEILILFVNNPQKIFSKKEIYNYVWSEIGLEDNNTVTVHIKTLREKLNENIKSPKFIKTIWGKGYMFIGEKVR